MTERHLPLFSWEPPECTVIPFPADRRIGHVRHVTRIFADQRTEKARRYYWSRTVSIMRKRLADAGIPNEVIDHEIGLLTESVRRELGRQGFYDAIPGPDSAA